MHKKQLILATLILSSNVIYSVSRPAIAVASFVAGAAAQKFYGDEINLALEEAHKEAKSLYEKAITALTINDKDKQAKIAKLKAELANSQARLAALEEKTKDKSNRGNSQED